jgi:hypothetical protein
MADENNILSFNEKREENIERKRRNFERILFNNFLGAYSVIDQAGVVFPIDMLDISHDGMSFKVPRGAIGSSFQKNEDLTLRMYFTKDTFIPVVTSIKWTKDYKGDDGEIYLEYGVKFDKSVPTFEALKPFIDFLYKFAELSTEDKGKSKVYYL